ncbi:MAG: FmdE family protein [Anaerovoracaceae bacterium]|jgi:formylmethanofuran dehydrogenase subunit E
MEKYQELWAKSVEFHGHECPGLAIGFRAAWEAMEILGEDGPAEDEEIVCVTENDACGVDAVQVLTGCTLGKGNLVYRPTGKMAFAFYSKNKNKKVRMVLKSWGDPERSREENQRHILEAPLEEVFDIKDPHYDFPEEARLFENRVCEECGELSPEHTMRFQDKKIVCRDCFKEYSRGW